MGRMRETAVSCWEKSAYAHSEKHCLHSPLLTPAAVTAAPLPLKKWGVHNNIIVQALPEYR